MAHEPTQGTPLAGRSAEPRRDPQEWDLSAWLIARGVSRVVAYPSAAIDVVLRRIDEHPSLPLIFGLSEAHAAWAALATAEVSGERTAVVLPAAFSVSVVGPIVASAVERHLPVDLVCLGRDPLEAPLPSWWRVVTVDRHGQGCSSVHDGPALVVADQQDAGSHVTTLPRAAAPEPACGDVMTPTGLARVDAAAASDAWIAEQTASGRPVVVALPPVLHPSRSLHEQIALDHGLPVATCGGADPFAREHPDLWLGRTGFVPCPVVVELLGAPGRAAIIAGPDVRLPSWIGSGVTAAADNPGGTSATPSNDRSPALTAITELADHFPAAWFVADAGAAHRYVAGAVANRGRPTLLTDGLTHMGWSLPTTLGASLAAPERTWVTVLGDGAALMSGTALAALAQHRVPSVVLLLDNGTLGARYNHPAGLRDRARLPAVDWVAFGASLGVGGARWRPGLERVPAAADRACAERRPFLLVVSTPPWHPDVQRFPIIIDDIDELLADTGAI